MLGQDRTPKQDVAFAIRQLVEVALRALSPGINDPFTAIECVNRLGEGLCIVVRRPRPSAYRFDENRRLRVIAEPMSLQRTDACRLRSDRPRRRRQRRRCPSACWKTLATIASCAADPGGPTLPDRFRPGASSGNCRDSWRLNAIVRSSPQASRRRSKGCPRTTISNHESPWKPPDVGQSYGGDCQEFSFVGRFYNAKVKRSSNRMASWALAIAHSRGGIFHSFAARFNTRNRSFRAASSVGKCPLERTARRNLAFKFLMEKIGGVNNPDEHRQERRKTERLPTSSAARTGRSRGISCPMGLQQSLQGRPCRHRRPWLSAAAPSTASPSWRRRSCTTSNTTTPAPSHSSGPRPQALSSKKSPARNSVGIGTLAGTSFCVEA